MAAPRSKKHDHRWTVISYNKDIRRPRLALKCVVKGCSEEEWNVCPLCKEDGNRRRHKRHHDPITDRELFNRALLVMTKAAMEYEKRWGPPVWTNKDRSCNLHGREHWTSREHVALGHYACEECHPSGMNGHDHSLCPGA